MEIKEQIKLAPYTTFKIGGEAKYFCEVKDQFDALTAFEFAKGHNLPVFILGGGSNVLISDKGFNGLVVRVVNSGIEVIDSVTIPNASEGSLKKGDSSAKAFGMNKDSVLLKIASGENWDNVVEFAVKNNWWGIENLSHIPGSSGAIAVQNVGAYGQEAKNIIDSVTVFDTQTHEIISLKNERCGFEYRSSIFNTSQKGRYIIFNIVLRLSKKSQPILEYRDLKKAFGGKSPSLIEIRNEVIKIRDKKFPFPTEAKKGNAGSFFKNLILNAEEFLLLKNRFNKLWGAEAAEKLENKKFTEADKIKVPTAFLLDICGLKDLSLGGAVINYNQPLVIVNASGKATAEDVLNLAKKVKNIVLEKLEVNIHIEPEFVGFLPAELKKLV